MSSKLTIYDNDNASKVNASRVFFRDRISLSKAFAKTAKFHVIRNTIKIKIEFFSLTEQQGGTALIRAPLKFLE